MMEATKREQPDYSEEQIKNARQLCGIIKGVPQEKSNLVVAIANAYIDGFELGSQMATAAGVRK
jgi:hypothetical protein